MAITVKRKSAGKAPAASGQIVDVVPVKEHQMQAVVSDPPDTNLPVKIDSSVIENDPYLKSSVGNLKRMAAIGAQIESLGTLRIGNGGVLITEEAIIDCVCKIKTKIADGGDLLEHSKVLAAIGNSISRLTKEFRSQNDSSPHKVPRRNTSFAPGSKVQLTQNNLHIHEK